MNEENHFSRNAIQYAITFLTIGLLTIIVSILFKPFNDWSFKSDSVLFGQFGDFIGGFVGTIFSLVAILLLYKTLIAQQKSIKKQDEAIDSQKKSFEIESFENTFFNLLKTQQELTDGIKAYFHTLNNNFSQTTTTVHGREFFAFSKLELQKIWKSIECDNYLGKFDDSDEYLAYLNHEIEELNEPDSPRYCVNPDDARYSAEKIKNDEILRQVNKYYGITKEHWSEIRKLGVSERIEAIYGLFFQRYHYAIGHFFRHLYHLILFVKEFKTADNKNNEINRKYINFIQAQMSSFEMMLLFYNAISFPKLLDLIKEFDFLENLAEEDLIHNSHNCIEGIKLKSRKNLLGFIK